MAQRVVHFYGLYLGEKSLHPYKGLKYKFFSEVQITSLGKQGRGYIDLYIQNRCL
jgi:hypothetical protein